MKFEAYAEYDDDEYAVVDGCDDNDGGGGDDDDDNDNFAALARMKFEADAGDPEYKHLIPSTDTLLQNTSKSHQKTYIGNAKRGQAMTTKEYKSKSR